MVDKNDKVASNEISSEIIKKNKQEKHSTMWDSLSSLVAAIIGLVKETVLEVSLHLILLLKIYYIYWLFLYYDFDDINYYR